jgi:alpha-L-fucosidase
VELNAMARHLQPGILINNRAKTPEDFGTPEGHIKAEEAGRDWEACMTLNDNWGYHRGDRNWKSAREVIMMLADCAQKGGNLLLNVGPDRDGVIPVQSQRILTEVGGWLTRNGEAIYETDRADVGWANWGKFTVKGHTLYLLVDRWVGSEFVVGRLSCQPIAARLVATGTPVAFDPLPHGVRLRGLPENPPDFPVTVIAVEMDRPPKHSSGPSYLNPVHSWFDPEVGIV